VGNPTTVSHPSWAVFGVGGLGVVIRGGGGGGASCGGGVMETQVSPFSCSLTLIESWFPRVLLVELLLRDVCIFEVFVGVLDYIVFRRITIPLGSVFKLSVVYPRVDDLFEFVLWFSFDDNWRWWMCSLCR